MTDFLQDLREIAEEMLDRFQVRHEPAEPARDVIERWVNLQLKIIKPAIRHTHFSDRIVMGALDPSQQIAIATIQKKFEDGTDVNPHLSKRILWPDYTDPLFSDWGIHHLHVNSDLEPSPSHFIRRSGKLLFAVVRPSDVYFVEIRPHGEDYVFAQKDILETVHRNWPALLETFRLKGVVGVSARVDDPKSIHVMRKGGVNVSQQIGNAVYAPMGGGITTAATGLEVTTQTDRLYFMIETAKDWLASNEQKILDALSQHGAPVPHSPKWKLVLTDRGFVILDQVTGGAIPVAV